MLCSGSLCSGAAASNLDQIKAAQAWAVTTDCTGGDMVYIVDFGNGVDIKHPALAPLPGIIYQNPIDSTFDGVDEDKNGYTDDVWGWDFYNNQEDPYPDGNDPYPWHDTAVTGIMATNGTNGAYGICRTAHVIVLKKHLADYYGDPTVINQIVEGLNYAVNFKREIESITHTPFWSEQLTGASIRTFKRRSITRPRAISECSSPPRTQARATTIPRPPRIPRATTVPT